MWQKIQQSITSTSTWSNPHRRTSIYLSDMWQKIHVATNLRSHEHIHSGKRQFICQICDKTFRRASSLLSHELIHTRGRLFVRQTHDKTVNHAPALHPLKRYHWTKCVELTGTRHVDQIKYQIHVSCECDQLFCQRLRLHSTFYISYCLLKC